jgi:predicted enzyme related to lactoylglutathione lyase
VDVDRGLPRTVDGIADVPVGRAAWLRDPDGNVIGLVEFQGHG